MPDSAKPAFYMVKANHWLTHDVDSAIYYVSIAQEWAEDQNQRDALIKAQELEAKICYLRKNYLKAADIYESTIAKTDDDSIDKDNAESIYLYSYCLYYLGRYDEALQYIKEANNYYRIHSDTTNYALTLQLIGEIFYETKDPLKAKEQFASSLALSGFYTTPPIQQKTSKI
ncbi:MAG: tetratricopeptide repeat protein [Bacteroidales bacterium]|nr:tetratricopeptide repeat protein [Bacteroidales bacterium]